MLSVAVLVSPVALPAPALGQVSPLTYFVVCIYGPWASIWHVHILWVYL